MIFLDDTILESQNPFGTSIYIVSFKSPFKKIVFTSKYISSKSLLATSSTIDYTSFHFAIGANISL